MGTSVIQDNAKFANVMANFKVHSTAAANGALVFAGTHWPLGVADVNAVGATSVGRQMRREIDYAFAEARAMLAAGFVKAAAACQGEEAAGLLMKKWFGRRQSGPGQNDWWQGAYRIIGQLQALLSKDINVFYRGDDTLIGKPDDYPGATGNLVARDVAGYAETSAGATDGNIGLCKLFFRRESGGVFKTAQKGRDSIGGCIVHELSHNYCGTEDHDGKGGGTCYGDASCQKLARERRRRAWYNADNIEYFCEDAYYGIVAAKQAIQSGAVNTASNLRNAHKQIIDALVPQPKNTVAQGGVRQPGQVTGEVALRRAIFQATAIVENPSLPTNPVVSTGKVSALRGVFEQ
ncbi:M35 family metallo-endopeptidase [Frateuria sp. YIM B11624]|uniref:M35 family metallo-endopeptidase n=1 Tax=Frateuria sp. YIM B11624 TaxID=3143185 RepID=UPI003C77D361